MIDMMQKPEVEYDDSFEGIVDVVWRSADHNESFSLVIQDGSIIGVRCSLEPSRSETWKVELPKGMIKIDCAAVSRT